MRHPLVPERTGRDRWLVSYADLVTLLFACFATAYASHVAASSSTATQPSTDAAAAVAPVAPAKTVAPAAPVIPALVPAAAPMTPGAPEIKPPTFRDLITPLVLAAVGESHVELIEDHRGLVISLPESATFPIGSATLTAEARSFLARLAAALEPTGARLRIEGHTDDAPVSGRKYSSNWELSTARASAVVLFLIAEASFAPERLSAAGYGEFHPRVANDTPENRTLNRRVDVVVLDPRGDDESVAAATAGWSDANATQAAAAAAAVPESSDAPDPPPSGVTGAQKTREQ